MRSGIGALLVSLALGACSAERPPTSSDGGSPRPVLPVVPAADAAAPSDGGALHDMDAARPSNQDAARPPNRDAAPPDMDAAREASLPILDGGGLDPDAALRFDTGIPDAGDEDDAGPPPPPRMDCSGKPGAPGDSLRMFGERGFIVHVPPNAHPNTALPVVFAVHGAGGKGSDMQLGTALDVLADQQGFIAVYPDGAAGNAPWNVGRGVCPPGNFVSTRNDDFAYFEYMLDDIEQDQCLNRERVFVTGFSMGGYFSHHIGCQRGGDLVRAVAAHSGGTYDGDCPGAPTPILILHGDADPLIDYQCALDAREQWIERNGCASDFDVIDIQGGRCEWQRGCPERGQVALCTFEGLQHAWGYPPEYDHSTLLIWLFFSLYL